VDESTLALHKSTRDNLGRNLLGGALAFMAAPSAVSAITSTNATTVSLGSGVISGGVSAANGDSPTTIAANTALGTGVAKVGTMSATIGQKILLPATAAVLGMGAIDLADDGQLNTTLRSDGALSDAAVTTTGITMLTSVIPGIPPIVANGTGSAADAALQNNEGCQGAENNTC